jgi:hypothetical protein
MVHCHRGGHGETSGILPFPLYRKQMTRIPSQGKRGYRQAKS